MKKLLIILFALTLLPAPAEALTRHEIAMFKKLQAKWKKNSEKLYRQRNKLKGSDPRYTGMTKQIIKADYWLKYYTEAQIDRSTTWTIIENTFVWSAKDLAETGSIMWNQSEGLLQKIYKGEWSDLLKETTDALMRQKVRKMIRARFGKEFRPMEDHIMDEFILPKVDKSKLHEYAEEAFGKAKDKLQETYVDEVKRQAASRTKEELKEYGEAIAKRVGGAVSAAEFTFDMVQKYVMWNDAQRTIETMFGHVQKIKKREKCSLVKAFNIYRGKEKLTAKKPTKKPEVAKAGKAPLAFIPHYVNPLSVNKTPPTLKGALAEIPPGFIHKKLKAPSEYQVTIFTPDGKGSGHGIRYWGFTGKVRHISFTANPSKGFKVTHFHKNGKAYVEEFKTPYPHRKLEGVRRAWDEKGAITHWMKYHRGHMLVEIHFAYGGKPVTAYFYEKGEKAGSIFYSYEKGQLVEEQHMYKGKVLK